MAEDDLRSLHDRFDGLDHRLRTIEARLSSAVPRGEMTLDGLRIALDQVSSIRSTKPRAEVCKICTGPALFFDAVDFNKYCGQTEQFVSDISGVVVPYFRCVRCDFTFTSFCDDWTSGDFSKYIYNDDYEVVDPEYKIIRPAYVADNMSKLLAGCEALRIIDYGAGSGRFALEMAQRGFASIENYDPFSSPDIPEGRFDVACLFEVIEHMPDPLQALRKIFSDHLVPSGVVILTQSIQPENFETIRGRWWYIGPRNGHISTFSEKTFETISRILDLVVFPLRPGYYAFCRRGIAFSGAMALFIERYNTASLKKPRSRARPARKHPARPGQDETAAVNLPRR